MQVNCHECAELPPSITAKDSRKSQRGWIVHHNAPKITGVTVISYFHWHANGEFSRSHDVHRRLRRRAGHNEPDGTDRKGVGLMYEKPLVQRFGSLRELTAGQGPNLGGDPASVYHRS